MKLRLEIFFFFARSSFNEKYLSCGPEGLLLSVVTADYSPCSFFILFQSELKVDAWFQTRRSLLKFFFPRNKKALQDHVANWYIKSGGMCIVVSRFWILLMVDDSSNNFLFFLAIFTQNNV